MAEGERSANPEDMGQPEWRDVEPIAATRAFEVLALTADPGGLTFQTREVLPRPSLKKTLAILSEEERAAILKRLGGESHDEKGKAMTIEKWLGAAIHNQEVPRAKQKGDGAHGYVQEYMHSNKVGLFHAQQEVLADGSFGNGLSVDVRSVPFPFYRAFNTTEHEEKGLTELANPTGVATVLLTGDGYFGLGRRGPKNGSYRASDESGGQPGAFSAGLMDMYLAHETPPGRPGRVSNMKIIRAADKESREEAGISSATYEGRPLTTEQVLEYAKEKAKTETGMRKPDIEEMRIICFGKDKVSVHNEIGVMARTGKTREELERIHAGMERSDDARDFSEDIFFIPATAEAVERFVTQCKAPMPPTHYMPLIGAMYNKMVVERGSTREARTEAGEWLQRVMEGIDKNWADIDKLVAEYYQENPQAIEENMREAQLKEIKTDGFDPKVLADRQVKIKVDGKWQAVTLHGELVRLGFSQDRRKAA